MTRRQKTTFTPHVDGLERREVLSTVSFSIPFVVAPGGTRQSAINFTSSTFHQVWNSLNTVARNFARTGNVTNADAQLQTISKSVPFGSQVLLDTWVSDLNSAGTGASAGNVLHQDLVNFIDTNEGIAFNVLKSVVRFSTDDFLTYNGRVGRNPPISQERVIGVPAT